MMENFRLFSWGANSHGQLGHGIASEQSTIPHQVHLPDQHPLKIENIQKIVGGAGHTLILDKKGAVYACGWNNKGQTGVSEDTQLILTFVTIESLQDEVIKDIACGWDSSMAINQEGTVYGWGSNAFGQLGFDPNSLSHSSKPIQIALECKVNKVSMGLRHTVLLTDDSTVFVSGSGKKGQLGLVCDSREQRPVAEVHTFTMVPGLIGINDVSCGQHHTIALTSSGQILTWGDNKYGQLGLDYNQRKLMRHPVQVQSNELNPSSTTHTGWTHSAVLDESDGKIYAWGRNTYGQIASLECQTPMSWVPSDIKRLPKIQNLCIGSEHNVALSDDGQIYTWGWNEHGNCGNGNVKNVFYPESINFRCNGRVVLIGCGAGHSFAVIHCDNN